MGATRRAAINQAKAETMAARDLPVNVYRKPDGFQVRVKLGGRLLAQRFPSGTPIARMVAKRDELRAMLAAMADARAGSALPYAVRTLREVATLLESLGDVLPGGDTAPPARTETAERVHAVLLAFLGAMHAANGPAAPAGSAVRRG
jgi:hypothetical protein